jgi:regulatory protein
VIYIEHQRIGRVEHAELSGISVIGKQESVSQNQRRPPRRTSNADRSETSAERPASDAPNAQRPTPNAYVFALRLLARRELSEAQIRTRLLRRSYDADGIDDAVTRLKAERALDDGRTAGAMARTAVTLKRRGRRRVRLEIERAGIAPAVARQAVEETFGDLDEEALLEAALERRRRPAKSLNDPAEFGRLYRYLVGQGFDPERVLHALTRRRS